MSNQDTIERPTPSPTENQLRLWRSGKTHFAVQSYMREFSASFHDASVAFKDLVAERKWPTGRRFLVLVVPFSDGDRFSVHHCPSHNNDWTQTKFVEGLPVVAQGGDIPRGTVDILHEDERLHLARLLNDLAIEVVARGQRYDDKQFWNGQDTTQNTQP